MKKIKFKTNINCGGCIAKVTPFLNEAVGEGGWNVDTNDPRKTLTVDEADAPAALQAIQRSGYKAEKI